MKWNSANDPDAHTWLLISKKENHEEIEVPPLWISKRLLVTIVLFFCYLNAAVITSNVNIAIVDMTSNKSFTEGNITITKQPEFTWDSTTEGVILSAFSYGALLSFLGSVPVNLFGGSVSCALAILIMGITTLMQPVSLHFHLYFFLASRFLTGLFQAFFNVCAAEIYLRWIPNRERSTLVSYTCNGANVGYTICAPILGFVAHRWGWQAIFHSTGTVSVILSIIVFVLIKNHPSQDKGISQKELLYIQQETTTENETKTAHRYKDLLLMKPILALIILQFVISWVPTLMNAYFPIYVRDLTQKNTGEVGLISSIPTATQILMFPVAGILMDSCKARSNLTTTQIHKLFLSIAMVTSSLFFVTIAFFGDFIVSLVIFVLIQIFVSPVHLIVELIIVGISPDDTSVVAGLGTFSQAVSSIVSRLITGVMITNHSLQEWNSCFLLMATILLFGIIIFLIYGSSEAQWKSLKHPDKQSHQSNEANELKLDSSTKIKK